MLRRSFLASVGAFIGALPFLGGKLFAGKSPNRLPILWLHCGIDGRQVRDPWFWRARRIVSIRPTIADKSPPANAICLELDQPLPSELASVGVPCAIPVYATEHGWVLWHWSLDRKVVVLVRGPLPPPRMSQITMSWGGA